MDNESDSRKRKRAGKEEVVDKALKEWFLQVRKKDARIRSTFTPKSRRPGKENRERRFFLHGLG